MARLIVALFLFLGAAVVQADEELVICYNYGCAARAVVRFSEEELFQVQSILEAARDAASERAALEQAVGRMYRLAGWQTPTWRDKGGDYEDQAVDGRMDCIDHSTNTETWLRFFGRRGWTKFHVVLSGLKRGVFAVHWAARIAESENLKEYIVDSWFYDNGEPAVVFGLDEWMKGAKAKRKPAQLWVRNE